MEEVIATAEITRTELVWPGKFNDDGSRGESTPVCLPFQVIETVNEMNSARKKRGGGKEKNHDLFAFMDPQQGSTFEDGWKNKLIWGDNFLVMSSLLEQFAGKIDLIYIDPPFATGADFSFETLVGETNEKILKEQTIIEEKAYRDTWGRSMDSYISMMYKRLALMRDLLAENGSIYVHCDWHVNSNIRLLMDEIFGRELFQREIIWSIGTSSGFKSQANNWIRGHDTIFYYSKSKSPNFNKQFLPLDEKTKKRYDKCDNKGPYKIYKNKDGTTRKVYLDSSKGRPITDCWTDIIGFQTINNTGEYVNYPTQKPEALLKRIIKASSNEGDLVADFFCGSGTTSAVAEKLGRRWIACDLGRWGVHTTRKRLLDVQYCKPFEIWNLGKYERQYWQNVNFSDPKSSAEETIYQYLAFILKLYGAKPLSGMSYIHGRKDGAMVHIGAVDAPVTIDQINLAVLECVERKQKQLHVLGWEWEMGLYDLVEGPAKQNGVKLSLFHIPREVMEQQAIENNDVRFFELAHLETCIHQPQKLAVQVELLNFIMPEADSIPEEVRDKITKWYDYIDYWAVDWNFKNDSFMQGWVSYRTRKDRTLDLKSDVHSYDKAGEYQVLIKVIDIYGNDSSKISTIAVR